MLYFLCVVTRHCLCAVCNTLCCTASATMFPHRIAVWRDTKDYADCIPAPPASQKFRWQANNAWNKPSVGMKVTVQNEDCLTASKKLLDAGMNPVVLNLADILVPGGCVESGSGAQEESIFRRSNYCKTLTEDHYPCESLTNWL